jgi:hypothetical protein
MLVCVVSAQVFVHPLQRVDMRATVGQQSSTTLAIAGGSADRLVAAYSSQPRELQATPAMLSLPAGGITALGLVFRPRSQGQQRVRRKWLVDGSLCCTIDCCTTHDPIECLAEMLVELSGTCAWCMIFPGPMYAGCSLSCHCNNRQRYNVSCWFTSCLLQVRVQLVDVNTRQLVHGLLVCTDAHLPPLHTQMEVSVTSKWGCMAAPTADMDT